MQQFSKNESNVQTQQPDSKNTHLHRHSRISNETNLQRSAKANKDYDEIGQ